LNLSDPGPERICRRLVVTGRVQGVYFRGSTEAFARSEQVAGWVRNLPDGSVEAVFEGARDAVERAIAFCRVGPRWARVERVDVREQPLENLVDFHVR
jgi:acylphosphatase